MQHHTIILYWHVHAFVLHVHDYTKSREMTKVWYLVQGIILSHSHVIYEWWLVGGTVQSLVGGVTIGQRQRRWHKVVILKKWRVWY